MFEFSYRLIIPKYFIVGLNSSQIALQKCNFLIFSKTVSKYYTFKYNTEFVLFVINK